MTRSICTARARRARFTTIALVAALWTSGAHAALTQWGAFASGDVRRCPAGLCSGTFLQQADDGGFLQGTAAVAYTPATPGEAFGQDFGAQATLVGGLALPELKAFAITPAVPERFTASASARGIQGFVFSGAGDQTFTLDVVLNGTVTGFGMLSGFVNIYEADGFDPDGEPIGRRLGSTSFFRSTTTDRAPTAVSFTLSPGDEIYLDAALFATSDSRSGTNSSADAFHTLTMSFRDPAGLAAASTLPVTSVPAPGTAGVSMLGVAAMMALRRRVLRAPSAAQLRAS